VVFQQHRPVVQHLALDLRQREGLRLQEGGGGRARRVGLSLHEVVFADDIPYFHRDRLGLRRRDGARQEAHLSFGGAAQPLLEVAVALQERRIGGGRRFAARLRQQLEEAASARAFAALQRLRQER